MPDSHYPYADQTTPLDFATCQHQLQIMQAWHCARPVLHQGLYRFINGMTGNSVASSSCRLILYLAGVPEPVDSAEVQVHPFQVTER